MGALRLGLHEERNGFRLREIHLPVQECAPREFSGLRVAGPQTGKKTKDPAKARWTAMAVELHEILTGVGMRRPEDDAESAIQKLPVSRIPNFAENQLAGRKAGGLFSAAAPKNAIRERESRRTGQTNDTNG